MDVLKPQGKDVEKSFQSEDAQRRRENQSIYYYSNKSRGQRKKTDTDTEVPAIVNSDLSRKAFRKNWARLIQKVYNVDPLKCQYCNGNMKKQIPLYSIYLCPTINCVLHCMSVQKRL